MKVFSTRKRKNSIRKNAFHLSAQSLFPRHNRVNIVSGKIGWHYCKCTIFIFTPTLKYEKSIPIWDFAWELIFAIYWLGKTKWKQIFPSAPTEISQFQNMASIKTNKIKKRTPLLCINFWKLTTLLFCPKRFLHSKGPKNAICLWLSHNKEHCRLNMQCPLS